MTNILQFYPNGEFTRGVISHRRLSKNDEPFEGIRCDKNEEGEIRVQIPARHPEPRNSEAYEKIGTRFKTFAGHEGELIRIDQFGYVLLVAYSDGVNRRVRFRGLLKKDVDEGRIVPILGSSNPEILSVPPKTRKKCDKLTTRMARNIRNGIYVLESTYGIECLSFLTLTIPALSEVGYKKVLASWGYMVNKILQYIRKRCKEVGYETQYVYCTEIQSKRLQLRNEYVPHIHCVFVGRQNARENWVIYPAEIRKEWTKIVFNITGEQFDNRALENLQRVRKSAGAYLSKYLSKGICDVSGIPELSGLLRCHWGGMSRDLSRMIRISVTRITDKDEVDGHPLASSICDLMPYLMDVGLVKWYLEKQIVTGRDYMRDRDRTITVGAGALRTPCTEGGLAELLVVVISSFSGRNEMLQLVSEVEKRLDKDSDS